MASNNDTNGNDGLPPPDRPDPARDFIAQTIAAWDMLKQYEGPDVVHALTRLALAQQLQKIGPLLENLRDLSLIAEQLRLLTDLAIKGELHAVARLTPIKGQVQLTFDMVGQAPPVKEVPSAG